MRSDFPLSSSSSRSKVLLAPFARRPYASIPPLFDAPLAIASQMYSPKLPIPPRSLWLFLSLNPQRLLAWPAAKPCVLARLCLQARRFRTIDDWREFKSLTVHGVISPLGRRIDFARRAHSGSPGATSIAAVYLAFGPARVLTCQQNRTSSSALSLCPCTIAEGCYGTRISQFHSSRSF